LPDELLYTLLYLLFIFFIRHTKPFRVGGQYGKFSNTVLDHIVWEIRNKEFCFGILIVSLDKGRKQCSRDIKYLWCKSPEIHGHSFIGRHNSCDVLLRIIDGIRFSIAINLLCHALLMIRFVYLAYAA